MIAINPFSGEDEIALKVMTWNVHCSGGRTMKGKEK